MRTGPDREGKARLYLCFPCVYIFISFLYYCPNKDIEESKEQMLIEPNPIRRAADNPRTPYPRQHGFQAHVASRAAMADPNLPSKGDDKSPNRRTAKGSTPRPTGQAPGEEVYPKRARHPSSSKRSSTRPDTQAAPPTRRESPVAKTKQRRCSSGGARLHHPPGLQ